jgi:murein DD-endopeptidase MepM/ murein hydrolase activator NlpD
MKKINFINSYEKKKMPKEKKFFYSVLVICVLTVAIASFISTYFKEEPITPKSTTAKEVVNNAQIKKDIPDITTEKPHEVITQKNEPEIKEDADTNKEIETIYSNETKIPEITEIEYPKFPVDGEILKSHSANTPVYSSTMNDWRIHEGIDILCDIGEKVHASASGKVVDIYEDYALGLTVLIEHNGYSTKYCNLSKVEGLSVGDSVKQGEIIAIVGDSAKYEISDKPHLHFEILEYGKSVDPYLYIK